MTPQQETPFERVYHLAGAHQGQTAAICLLWDASRDLELGEVRFFNRSRQDDLYLDRLSRGEYHWIDETSLQEAYLAAPSELRLRGAAVYVPCFSR